MAVDPRANNHAPPSISFSPDESVILNVRPQRPPNFPVY
jgi:hypothetical protein